MPQLLFFFTDGFLLTIPGNKRFTFLPQLSHPILFSPSSRFDLSKSFRRSSGFCHSSCFRHSSCFCFASSFHIFSNNYLSLLYCLPEYCPHVSVFHHVFVPHFVLKRDNNLSATEAWRKPRHTMSNRNGKDGSAGTGPDGNFDLFLSSLKEFYHSQIAHSTFLFLSLIVAWHMKKFCIAAQRPLKSTSPSSNYNRGYFLTTYWTGFWYLESEEVSQQYGAHKVSCFA